MSCAAVLHSLLKMSPYSQVPNPFVSLGFIKWNNCSSSSALSSLQESVVFTFMTGNRILLMGPSCSTARLEVSVSSCYAHYVMMWMLIVPLLKCLDSCQHCIQQTNQIREELMSMFRNTLCWVEERHCFTADMNDLTLNIYSSECVTGRCLNALRDTHTHARAHTLFLRRLLSQRFRTCLCADSSVRAADAWHFTCPL